LDPSGNSPLSDAVQALVCEHVNSFEKLEILLLMRQDPLMQWTFETVSTRLNLPSSVATTALEELAATDLLEAGGSGNDRVFRYVPRSQQMSHAVDELATTYQVDRLALMRLLATSSVQRMRSSLVKAFADAFRVRGPKGKGPGNG
jgi:hypothetical protein